MNTLIRLKQDLRQSQDLGDIIDVLKSTALIQFRLFQAKDKPNNQFNKELEACFDLLVSGFSRHPYFLDQKDLPSALVVLTSDEGFLGELNTLLVNTCLDQRGSLDDELIVIGERGVRYLEDAKERFTSFPGIPNDINFEAIDKLRTYLLKGFRQRRFGRITVIYPHFVSLTLQKVSRMQLLPYLSQAEQVSTKLKDTLIEPSADRVLEALVKLWLGAKILEIFWSTKQSEFAARIMHLEGSTQELSFLNRKLAFDYFRQVHALNDKTIREISASKVLLVGKRI